MVLRIMSSRRSRISMKDSGARSGAGSETHYKLVATMLVLLTRRGMHFDQTQYVCSRVAGSYSELFEHGLVLRD